MQSLTWESCYDGCLAFCIHSASVCLTKGFEWKTFCLCHGTALFSITKKRTNRPNRRIIIFIHAMNMLPTFSNISIYYEKRRKTCWAFVHVSHKHFIYEEKVFFPCCRPLYKRAHYMNRWTSCTESEILWHFDETPWNHVGKTCLEHFLKMCEYWSKRAEVFAYCWSGFSSLYFVGIHKSSIHTINCLFQKLIIFVQ